MEDIANQSFLPASCMQGRGFLPGHGRGRSLISASCNEEAHAKGTKLKFVASYKEGKAAVGLQHIDPLHDLYHLYGKDNVVLFYTDRYRDQSRWWSRGAGAGADDRQWCICRRDAGCQDVNCILIFNHSW